MTPEEEARLAELQRKYGDVSTVNTSAPAASRDPYPFAPQWAESLPFFGGFAAAGNALERSSKNPQSALDYVPNPFKFVPAAFDMVGGIKDTIMSGDPYKIADLTARTVIPAAAGAMTGGALAFPVAAGTSFLYDQFSQLLGGQKDTPFNEDVSRFTSTELPLMGAIDVGIRKGVPKTMDYVANNIYSRETGIGGLKRAQVNDATLATAMQSPNYIPEQFPNRNIGDTARGLANKSALVDSEAGAIDTGLFRGGSRIDVDPNSPTAGQFVGEGASTLSEMAPVLKQELPKVAEARDIALTRYDQATAAFRADNPGSGAGLITGESVLSAPMPTRTLNPKTGAYETGQTNAANLLAREAYEGHVKSGEAGSQQARAVTEELGKSTPSGGVTISEAIIKRKALDVELDELGAYSKDPSAAATRGYSPGQIAELIRLKTIARNAWSYAIQQTVEASHKMFGGSKNPKYSVPTPEYVRAMTDAYHHLSPYLDALSGWAERVGRGVRNQPVDGPKDPALPALNVMHATTGPTGLINRAATWVGNKLLSRSPEQIALDSMRESQAFDTRGMSNIQTAIERTGRNPGGSAPYSQYTPLQSTPPLLSGSPRASAVASGALDASVMRGDAQIQTPNISGMLQKLPSLVQEAHSQEPELSPIKAPDPLSVALTPQRPEAREGFQIPRNMRMVDPQGVSNLLLGYVEPERVMPLVSQWRRVTATGDKKQMASFLGALSESYPDFPLSRGPVTGLPSEFDIGDGKTRLFSPTDIAKWEQEIDKSPLREDEKAQRIIALRKDGIVVPFTTKINTISDEEIAKSPENRAMQHLQKTYQFKPREQGAYGSRRLDG